MPTITIGTSANVEAWLAAEAKIRKGVEQPPGSVTTAQYAKMVDCSESCARRRLRALWRAGGATRVHFHTGDQRGAAWAYSLNNKIKNEKT